MKVNIRLHLYWRWKLKGYLREPDQRKRDSNHEMEEHFVIEVEMVEEV